MARHRTQRRFARRNRQRFQDRAQPVDGRTPDVRLHVCPNCWTSRVEVIVGRITCTNCGTFCVRCGLETLMCRGGHGFATPRLAPSTLPCNQ
jgi:hypothetical protein